MENRFQTNELRIGGVFSADCTSWRTDFFKDTRSVGLYCDDDYVEVECLNFSFMNMLRDELRPAARLWNVHKIRPSTNVELASHQVPLG